MSLAFMKYAPVNKVVVQDTEQHRYNQVLAKFMRGGGETVTLGSLP